MSILIDHQSVNLPTGTREVGPVNLPVGITKMKLILARCTTQTPNFWPDQTTTIDAEVRLSNDGGATYSFSGGGFAARGGIITGRGGVQLVESYMEASVPVGIGGTSWRAKVVGTIVNGPLRSELTLEAN